MVLKTVRYALRLHHKVNGLIQREANKMNKNTKKEFRAYAEAYAHAIKAGFSSADAHYLAETYIENESAKAGN